MFGPGFKADVRYDRPGGVLYLAVRAHDGEQSRVLFEAASATFPGATGHPTVTLRAGSLALTVPAGCGFSATEAMTVSYDAPIPLPEGRRTIDVNIAGLVGQCGSTKISARVTTPVSAKDEADFADIARQVAESSSDEVIQTAIGPGRIKRHYDRNAQVMIPQTDGVVMVSLAGGTMALLDQMLADVRRT